MHIKQSDLFWCSFKGLLSYRYGTKSLPSKIEKEDYEKIFNKLNEKEQELFKIT